jgi:hypothetical protein
MQIELTLTPEERTELERQAEESGTDVKGYIQAVVQQALRIEDEKTARSKEPYAEWKAAFDAWIAGHRSRNPNFDDSRESIYD